ncbi:MAG: hypothetical protein KF819_31160 [Labilithrix sp.]|nr:hypothetical protein [Labilithrix sp.]
MNRTRVMERRPMPSSGVVPVAPKTSPMPLVQEPPRLVRRESLPSVVIPLEEEAPASMRSPESTQLSRVRKNEIVTYRRLAIALVIGFAFASGLAASFGMQASQASDELSQRQSRREPRAAITRSASLRLTDGAERKAEPAPEPAAKASPRRGSAARRAAAPSTEPAPAAAPVEEAPNAEVVFPNELLGKGIAD